MSKILMLWPDKREDWPMEIRHSYPNLVKIDNLYKPVHLLGRVLRKLMSRFNLNTSLFFDSWKNQITSFDIIIIHANINNRSVPRILRKSGFKGRIIYWYWNPVASSIDPMLIEKEYCEIWSFDFSDCQNYNLKFNSTYYLPFKSAYRCTEEIDFYFVGRDKGRLSMLLQLKSCFESKGFKCFFNIITDKSSKVNSTGGVEISYTENLEYVRKSKVILDLVQKNQNGLTLRVMEGLFFQKKIITSNPKIKEYDFYKKGNIYIINENYEGFEEFMETPYQPIDQSLIEYYFFENWLARFEN